jgi:hypothetical protein
MRELLDAWLEASAGLRAARSSRAMVEKIIRPRWGARKVNSIVLAR